MVLSGGWRRLTVAVTVIAGPICFGPPYPPECRRYDWFFDKPIGERGSEFASLPLEQGLDVSLCGQRHHPPMMFDYELAQRGPAIVPEVLERLVQAKTTTTELSLSSS